MEGSIGSGKTTLLDMIEKGIPSVGTSCEPVAEWRDVDGHNLLDMFYRDPPRYAFMFQTHVCMTIVRKTERALRETSAQSMVTERSVISNLHVFAKLQRELGNMCETEMASYCAQWDFLTRRTCPDTVTAVTPRAYIWLDTTPADCKIRIAKRNRREEDGITHDYLSRVHERHEAWLRPLVKNGQCLRIDGSLDFVNNSEIRTAILGSIAEFISSKSSD